MMRVSRIEIALVSLPASRLRILITAIVFITLTGLPVWLGGLVIWFGALRYLPWIRGMALTIGEHKMARRAHEEAAVAHTATIRERDDQIARLKHELARERALPRSTSADAEEPVYRQVGLHPRAPDWLVEAARRAYRNKLHPDRNLKHQEAAHVRFLKAEAAFGRIAELRK